MFFVEIPFCESAEIVFYGVLQKMILLCSIWIDSMSTLLIIISFSFRFETDTQTTPPLRRLSSPCKFIDLIPKSHFPSRQLLLMSISIAEATVLLYMFHLNICSNIIHTHQN